MQDLVLYNKPECPFCWKVRIALCEAGIDARLVDSATGGAQAVWRSLTPNQTVPVLVGDGLVIHESTVILEYLADRSGHLLPKSPSGRVVPRLINAYCDSVVGGGLREVVFEKRGKKAEDWDQARIDAGVAAFEQALVYLSGRLGPQPYFGTDYSMAECALTARLALAEVYGVRVPERFRNLREWYARMKARPSFGVAFPLTAVS